MGRVVPEHATFGIRELPEGNYLIVYWTKGDDLEVLTVYEGHRLLRLSELPEEAGKLPHDSEGGG